MAKERLTGFDKAKHVGLPSALASAYINDKISEREAGVILRAQMQRKVDLELNTESLFPSESDTTEAKEIMRILAFLEVMYAVPAGIWDEDVAIGTTEESV